jgi:hypothetical protein
MKEINRLISWRKFLKSDERKINGKIVLQGCLKQVEMGGLVKL